MYPFFIPLPFCFSCSYSFSLTIVLKLHHFLHFCSLPFFVFRLLLIVSVSSNFFIQPFQAFSSPNFPSALTNTHSLYHSFLWIVTYQSRLSHNPNPSNKFVTFLVSLTILVQISLKLDEIAHFLFKSSFYSIRTKNQEYNWIVEFLPRSLVLGLRSSSILDFQLFFFHLLSSTRVSFSPSSDSRSKFNLDASIFHLYLSVSCIVLNGSGLCYLFLLPTPF